jgi:hypothetical protein
MDIIGTSAGIHSMGHHLPVPLNHLTVFYDVSYSVAEPELEPEPEPVEQQLFDGAGAGAKDFLDRLRSRVCKFL